MPNTYKDFFLKDVTRISHLWDGKDPVRPHLNSIFKSSGYRKVIALTDRTRFCAAFICIASTNDIPSDEGELQKFSCKDGGFVIPYSVWSMKRGAGREIIKRLIDNNSREVVPKRIVTLSPTTSLARRFHIKNGAIELRVNSSSVNFEYK